MSGDGDALPFGNGKKTRKKPARRPRVEAPVRLKNRRFWYVRIWLPGAKRPVYRSCGSGRVEDAEGAVLHLHKQVRRDAAARKMAEERQLMLGE